MTNKSLSGRGLPPIPENFTSHDLAQACADLLRMFPENKHYLQLARTYEALKPNSNWPHLAVAYDQRRFPLFEGGDLEVEEVNRFKALCEHLNSLAVTGSDISTMQPLVIRDDQGRPWLISAYEMFLRIIHRPAYYIEREDIAIFKKNISAYRSFDGANLFEPCVGNGEKFELYLSELDKIGVRPRNIFLNDIDEASLYEAIQRARKYGNVVRGPGDVSRNEFFRTDFFKILKQRPEPTVFSMHGGTINNFANKRDLLINLNYALKPGSEFFISADHTTDRDTLSQCYNCVEHEQWLIYVYVTKMWEMELDIDPSHIYAHIAPILDPSGQGITLKSFISNYQRRELEISYGDKSAVFTLEEGSRACDENAKLYENKFAELFPQAGLKITQRLRNKDKDPKNKSNVVVWHGTTATRPLRPLSESLEEVKSKQDSRGKKIQKPRLLAQAL